ncbi:MAG: transposase, partial [Chloroflexi bacterium]|nr:transposase [Chloroflexota bacterium]
EAFGQFLTEDQMRILLDTFFPEPGKGANNRLRIMEAGVIAYYQNQTRVPVVRNLLSDNGPEYGKITENRGLCWIHGGRSYKKLNPVVPMFREELENFLNRYWNYYQSLSDYRDNPDPREAERLSREFDDLFSTVTNYPALNAKIKKTRSKKAGYLLVLRHPEIEPHNNPAELGARAQARKRDVSLHTITQEGTESQDTFLTIVETAKKLGRSAYEHIFDRIGGKFELPSLASLIPKPKDQLTPFYDTS